MHILSTLLGLALLTRLAWASGYGGALERVWMFYAYNIDQENGEADRTLGFRCVNDKGKPAFDTTSKTCKGSWQSCQSALGKQSRCNFNELMHFLGKYQRSWNSLPAGIDQNTKTPPIEDTAKSYYNKLYWTQNTPIPNYQPQAFLKTTNGEYTDMIKQIGNKVVSSGPSLRGRFPELFEGFAQASDKIVEARVGDHGPSLTKAWDQYVSDNGLKDQMLSGPSAREDVGPGKSPVDKRTFDKDDPKKVTGRETEVWQTLKYSEVVDYSMKTGRMEFKAVLDRFRDFQGKFYATKKAEAHRTVFQAYRTLSLRVRTC